MPYEALMETDRRTVLEKSQEGTCQRIFVKRKDKTAFKLGDEARGYSRYNLTYKDKKGRFIECGKIPCKSGPKSVFVRRDNGQ